MPVVVNPRLTIPDDELRWRFNPSGGPGGQHANRAHTRVDLTWDPSTSSALTSLLDAERDRLLSKASSPLRVTVDQSRSQHRNRATAEQRLAQRVRSALAPPPKKRRPTKPSRAAQRRRLESKRRTGTTKRLRRKLSSDD